jgi:HAD superfamily phosphoserine phosphatase-like hydrolase
MKLAIFDVDGTLFDGNLGIEFLKVLIKEQIFPPEIGKQIFALYEKYKSGEIEKSIVVDQIYELYAIGMKDCNTKDVNRCALATWEIVKERSFPFVEGLIKGVMDKQYRILLISGSPIEMITIFANSLGIDDDNIIAGTIGIKDGIYTGDVISYPGSSEQKIESLDLWISENDFDIDWESSIAMGDNERDYGILKRVGQGFAINPNNKLFELIEGTSIAVVDEETLENIFNY